ncbi:Asp23/Gls24 family envelope stress response protein [Thermobispora bispora]|jgi:uncharacterized alkaline shock family protein YloU|uniref:Asp23/Gls24 family envelope stress response protein n=1 Tax=Thermobispora bispora (strain ATCC 19993 / DSM 43833 / CBS 139.67 / JCM 10125 / KCTC 9307 / NBRC 14880 / R51) TaxID=469371 RepID=D6Y9N5_THEBD|nr:Asp23/Gls24 family envelope stress response protein [Thermobispora bispora]MBO2473118.1 Asp23/Gls24 family envelope stress response protein [Actinomycetales bacterium]MDI9581518.1 Asp23/Gls24 family envelope stress response protein [Thermobispora sp.]ADG90066.1 hypothetical protein Tbis_3376 [Thermobispora bispora DSM 43833]MBX6168270.1 Asp23/Gls24 family envelope stress response protein [Thermobispora bispora]QSI46517.1 Asp23/Gls24 family envelope stress response protein [Thermobispora bis
MSAQVGGATTVSGRAFVKIAERVAAEDERLAGTPRVTAELAGGAAVVHVDLEVRYPAPVPSVAGDLRERLRHRVSRLTGVPVVNVDIDVVRLVPVGGDSR